MGKRKRIRAQQSEAPIESQAQGVLCGCNPEIAAQVIVVVGRNKAEIDRATDRLNQDPNVAIVAFATVGDKPLALYKGCAPKIAHLSKTLRELVEGVEAGPPDADGDGGHQ